MKINSVFTYNIDMYNRNKRYWNIPVHPDNILEIRLNQEVWAKVVKVATMKQTTYSWVVRYCVFRLIQRKDPRRNMGNCISYSNSPKFDKLDSITRQHPKTANLHRHKLCLYEEDEFFIRMSAALMNCTMSHLVRLCLQWNLDELERMSTVKSNFHALAFYWLGIKLYEGVVLPTYRPEDKDFRLIRLKESEYW